MEEIKGLNWEIVARQLEKERDHFREITERQEFIFREAIECLTKDFDLLKKRKLDETELRDAKLEITKLFIDYGRYSDMLGELKRSTNPITFVQKQMQFEDIVELEDLTNKIMDRLYEVLNKI